MSQELRYGEGGTLRLDLPAEAIVAECTRVRAVPLDDPAAAVAAALENPLDFPPLSSATIPGDRVAVAVDRGMPEAARVVAGVVHALLQSGAQPADITIVTPGGEGELSERDLVALLPDDVRDVAGVVTHDPDDPAGLCYLAVSKGGRPLYLNRALCEADVVLPVGTARLQRSLGYLGVHGGLFPLFADRKTQQRFFAPGGGNGSDHQRRRRGEADEAAWLLGVQLTMQVVPGPGESVLHVLAGTAEAVAQRADRLCDAAWLYDAPGRASLVVATIEGGREQQTWDNLARALFTASHVVADRGAIVLCTNLQAGPGPSLRRLTQLDQRDAMRKIQRDRTPDAVPASVLAEMLGKTRVYLLSGLEEAVVEDLGLGHVARPDEVGRLSRQHDSCILLANAQHACFRRKAGV